jgi:hypothetical protein
MSAEEYYTTSLPKRPDVNGTPEQVYAFNASVIEFIIKGIRGKYITGLGTVNYNTELQYLFDLQVHTDINGDPTKIIGNLSNKKGEFVMGECDITSIAYFAFVAEQDTLTQLPVHFLPSKNLTTTHLAGTQWAASATTKMVLVGTFFPIFSGLMPVFGELRDPTVKANFDKLGVGYDQWANAVILSKNDDDDIDTILERIKSEGSHDEFCHSEAPTMRRISKNGPVGTIIQVQSDRYPIEAKEIKEFFLGTSGSSPVNGIPTSITIRAGGEDEKDAEANLGWTINSLFNIGATVDFSNGTVTNVMYPIPSQSMKSVMSIPRSARNAKTHTILTSGMKTAKAADRTSIFSKYSKMPYIQKNHTNLLMAGTFDSLGAADVANDLASLSLAAYLPQVNSEKIAKAMIQDKKIENERAVGMADIHQAKPKTTLTRLGMMSSTDDFLSLCVNKINETAILWDIEAMRTANADIIFRQIAYNMLLFVNDSPWEKWVEQCVQPMPHLHWQLYSILEKAWTHCVDFATDFQNINVFEQKKPLAELNFNSLKSAITVYTVFRDEYNKLITMTAPCVAIPRIAPQSVAAATSKRPAPAKGAIAASDSDNDVEVVEKPSPSNGEKKKKKKKRRLQSDNDDRRSNTEMGIFYCKEANIPVSQLFPKNLKKAPCAGFSAIGKECRHGQGQEKCNFPHPKKPAEVDFSDLCSIGDHFLATGHGWFNKNAFTRFTGLPDKYKALLGNASGPTRT